MFAVRKISASDLAKLRAEAFERFLGLQDEWTQSCKRQKELKVS